MEIADSEVFRLVLEAEIRRYASRPVDLLIVDDIAQWAATRKGNAKGNPVAMAITDGETSAWGILLCRQIDAAWVSSVISRREFGGFLRTRDVLHTPEIFLRHVVILELAHLENNWGQEHEEDCDAWAFDKLGINAI